ncbi:MAG TPA: hypothetical protein VF897_21235 [Roseiflexaceae bacterium]
MPSNIAHPLIRGAVRLGTALALVALALAALSQGARLVFRSDPQDGLRQADALFAAGRYHDARTAYGLLVARAPALGVARTRLGIVYAVRDERAAANETLAAAIGLRLAPREHDLVRLYQGRVAAAGGQRAEAMRFWTEVGARSPLYPIRHVLEAENILAVGDYAGAEAAYRAALLPGLPRAWRALAHTRLAMLRASSDPQAALAALDGLTQLDRLASPAETVWTAPLLPDAQPDARQVGEALRAPASQRAQLLGQLYLGAGLYALAEAQFAAVAPDSPSALSAAAYAAYTRWSAGDRDEGLSRLKALVAAYPDEPRARALLALAYLAASDAPSARACSSSGDQSP